MELEKILPSLPPIWEDEKRRLDWGGAEKTVIRRYGLACARAAAVAALDESLMMNQIMHNADARITIRRLRDTIAKGE